jgi:hypothetical protein
LRCDIAHFEAIPFIAHRVIGKADRGTARTRLPAPDTNVAILAHELLFVQDHLLSSEDVPSYVSRESSGTWDP